MREVYTRELFPNREQSNYNGSTPTLSVLNLAYYPTERGPYNFSPTLDINGRLPNPRQKWGGMMRKLDTNDFEMANIDILSSGYSTHSSIQINKQMPTYMVAIST